MYYRLKDQYALRGWQEKHFCLLDLSDPYAIPLRMSASDFFVLSDCDGSHDLEETALIRSFLDRGIIEPGTAPLRDEQDYIAYPFVQRSSARISITNRCNCRCPHCYAADENGALADEISFPAFGDIIGQLKETGIRRVRLTGGEPLLHPDLENILRLLYNEQMRLELLYTNGILLNKHILGLLGRFEPKPIVRVSFDGFGVHDWMRGRNGAEHETLNALSLLKENGFPIEIAMSINGRTINSALDSCRQLVRSYDCDLYIFYTSPSPRWLAAATEKDLLSLGEYFDFCRDLCAASIAENWGCFIKPFLHPGNRFKESAQTDEAPLNEAAKKAGRHTLLDCPQACAMIHIANDGRVLPCSGFEGASRAEDFLTDDDSNIYKRRLKDILTDSSYLEPFRATMDDLLTMEDSCRSCRWLYLCKGGCRLLSLDQFRDDIRYDRKSDYQCLFYRGGYYEKYTHAMKEATLEKQRRSDENA